MKAARFSIGIEHLIHLMGLPPDTDIHAVQISFDSVHSVDFIIEHPSLPDVKQGDIYRNVRAVYRDGKFVEWLP